MTRRLSPYLNVLAILLLVPLVAAGEAIRRRSDAVIDAFLGCVVCAGVCGSIATMVLR